MHAHLIDLQSLLRKSLPSEAVSSAASSEGAMAGVLEVLRWLHQALRGRKSQPLVVVSPAVSDGVSVATACQKTVLQALAHLPVATLQGGCSSRLAWGLAKTLQSQGARVSLYSDGPSWWQAVGPRTDWSAVTGRKQVRAESFYKDTEQPEPSRVPQWLALHSEAVGLSAKQAQALLSKYAQLPVVLESAQNFMTWSAEPAWAQILSEPARQHVVRQAWQNARLDLRPSGLAQAELHWGRLDELALAEVLQDAGVLEDLDNFLAWAGDWERAAPSKSDCLQVQRAWAHTKSAWPGLEV